MNELKRDYVDVMFGFALLEQDNKENDGLHNCRGVVEIKQDAVDWTKGIEPKKKLHNHPPLPWDFEGTGEELFAVYRNFTNEPTR